MAQRKRKRYDDKFRASAVVMLEAAGYPQQAGALTSTAKHLGVPHNTLRSWFHGQSNPPPSELRQEKKGDLVALINTELRAIFKDLPDARLSASYRDMVTAVGILVDKKQLLTDGPTENSRTRIVIEYQDVDIDPAEAAPGTEAGDTGIEPV